MAEEETTISNINVLKRFFSFVLLTRNNLFLCLYLYIVIHVRKRRKTKILPRPIWLKRFPKNYKLEKTIYINVGYFVVHKIRCQKFATNFPSSFTTATTL